MWWGLLSPYLASLCFSGSLVFYNSYLPEIAQIEDQDSLSARGFALGYLGSSIVLILSLVFVQNPDWLGTSDVALVTRISFVFVGIWWLFWGEFSLYRLPSGVSILMKKNKGYVIESYRRLFLIVKEFKNIAGLNRFLLGFFFASAGVQTVILIASLFGTKVLGLDSSSLIMTILLIQFVAILGSWSFAKLSDRFGNIRSLILACLLWIMICILAFFVNSPLQFYFLGSAVGLVMGGLQSLGRSTFSKMLPPEDEHVTYFSFFDIAEKLATVLGMVAVGWVETVTGNLRLSPLVLSIFFMIAVFLWFGVNKFYRSQKNFG
jgi:UMF1 family MFS transporter